MKKIFVATAALALMAGGSAYAQGEQHHDEHGGGAPPAHAESRGGPPAGGGYRPQAAPEARPAQAPQYGAAPHYAAPQGGGAQNGGPRYNAPQNGGGQYNGGQHYGAANNGYRQGGAPAFQGRPQNYAPSRPGWGAPAGAAFTHGAPRYDPHYFPRVVTLGARYHWGGGYWYPQRGYYYHRWVYGEYLPFGWYDQSYWVSDYWDYDLPVPPYGYTWVRVGPDVMLINMANGFVAESIYGVFY